MKHQNQTQTSFSTYDKLFGSILLLQHGSVPINNNKSLFFLRFYCSRNVSPNNCYLLFRQHFCTDPNNSSATLQPLQTLSKIKMQTEKIQHI